MRLLIISALLLGGCAPVQPRNEPGAELAGVLQGRISEENRTCVPIGEGRSLSVVDSRTLIYDGGDTLWVNRLRSECPGLSTSGTLIVEPSTGQYCKGDRFREVEWSAAIPGPYCFLGDFTAYRRSN